MVGPVPKKARRYTRPGFVAAALVIAGALLAGCSGPPPGRRPEVLQQVQVRYDRAVRKALDEVPDSRLLSVGLRRVSAPEPVWLTRVATRDGTVHVVRVDATLGRLLSTSDKTGQSAQGRKSTAALASSAKLLPEEAVDKVASTATKDPHFGKVTDVALEKGQDDRTVWSVTVATVQSAPTITYQVDAVTAEVVDSHSAVTSPPN
ncbi:PepSY domain-containing protein [Streptomyces sp. SLBN-31]|uniref:PepSY domain-containing protein n=1 Tax=Streptomyces sp. SLBN-31 TaxID=2768444 RepID=UPI0011522F88|nr:PepSY domain-containing protein [Streptomyces sp. SLBN-31]TQJ91274.1 peptidase YpeB-like protein [Streptomyces sp. SLBN-31]